MPPMPVPERLLSCLAFILKKPWLTLSPWLALAGFVAIACLHYSRGYKTSQISVAGIGFVGPDLVSLFLTSMCGGWLALWYAFRTKPPANFGSFYTSPGNGKGAVLSAPGGLKRGKIETSWEKDIHSTEHHDWRCRVGLSSSGVREPRLAAQHERRHIFVESDTGREIFLRGINVSGGDKYPVGKSSLTPWNETSKDVSFVNRPFPLAEADEHLGRMRAFGLTFFRLLITWEAVEPLAPGKYDEEYLQYLKAVVKKAGEFGISVFIDPHQDVWSRWTGGDGAPRWTLEAIGLDVNNLDRCYAAMNQQNWPAVRGGPSKFPHMIWACNYNLLANSTMWCLFFGGNDFASDMFVSRSVSHTLTKSPADLKAVGTEGTVHYRSGPSGELPDPEAWLPVQDFLQGHFIEAMGRVASELKDLENVLGFDTLNEPDYGYIGRKDLSKYLPFGGPAGAPNTFTLSAHEQMLLGSGLSKSVPVDCDFFNSVWTFQRRLRNMNYQGLSVWKKGFKCVWAAHGVYDSESGKLLKSDYFQKRPGSSRPVEVTHDHMAPFWFKMQRRIRSELGEKALMFCSPFALPLGQERNGYAVDISLYDAQAGGVEVCLPSEGVERAVKTGPTVDRGPGKPSWGCVQDEPSAQYSSKNMVYAGHYYEALQLGYSVWLPNMVSKQVPLWMGGGLPAHIGSEESTVKSMAMDLWTQMEFGRPLGPSILGEIGIDMHIKGEEARARTYERKMRAMEQGRINGYTLWNYTPDTSSSDKNLLGDGFNGESLSIWAREERSLAASSDPYFNGGRALSAIVRPSPHLVGGRLRSFGFQGLTHRREFTLEVEETGRCTCKKTEIFLPYYQYGGSFEVEVSGGSWDADVEGQKLVWTHEVGKGEGFVHKLRLWKK